ncbi:MAG TPA: winged helix DNA-binding domain-containing protein [Vicinamibacterales bacterium]|jgi:hypothetical protein|nr:winged helix DNA-binding domain-containing protein [Vicinamibacterales bacterium]
MPRAATILAARLHNHWLARPSAAPRSAAAVVERLCAVQAQDFIGAKWAIGLRAKGLDDAAVEAAFDRGDILRTHVMRPTWHFVTPADLRWMLALTAPRVHQASAFYYRQYGLDAKTVSRVHKVLASELQGGRFRTRTELAAALAKRGIEARGPRLGLLTIHAELEQVMCSGPVRGKQLTYALLDERAPGAGARTPRDPLGELASRYFASHGPATLRDFVWWSGLTVAQAKKGVEHASLERREIDGLTYWAADWDGAARMPPATFLLPNYDEYVIAYKDRDLLLPHGPAPRGGIAGLNAFEHPLVVDGVLAGYWTRRVSGATTRVELRRNSIP